LKNEYEENDITIERLCLFFIGILKEKRFGEEATGGKESFKGKDYLPTERVDTVIYSPITTNLPKKTGERKGMWGRKTREKKKLGGGKKGESREGGAYPRP